MRATKIAIEVKLAAILIAFATGSTSANEISTARAEGIRLYEAGRFQEAIPFFDRVLARRARDLEIAIKRGACYLRIEQPEKALEDFDRVNAYSAGFARFFPTRGFLTPGETWIPLPSSPVWFAESVGNRGIALLMLGRDEEALQSFLAATQLWALPENQPGVNFAKGRSQLRRGRASAYEGLGQASHRLGRDEQAFQAYSEAINTDPTDPNGFAGRGDTLAALHLLEAAVSDYTDAIRLDPSHSRAYCGRGIALLDLGRDEPALADFNQAISLDSKFAKAYHHRGALRARRGENEAALADYDVLIGLLPKYAGAYKDRGGVLVRVGQFDRAKKDLDAAIQLDPKSAAAYQNRGAAYNGLGQYERAVKDLTEAIRLDPENAGAYTNRGLANFAIGDYDQAVADLSQGIQLAPRNAVPYFNRAEVFTRLGLLERALEDYKNVIRLDPSLTAAHVAIGRLHDGLGQRERALRDFDMALQLDPKGVGVYYDRGNLRREQGDWRGALADYDRAVVLDPNRAEIYVARGWSRLCAGVEGADYDARAFLSLKGWRDGLSPYMAMLAVLGAQAAGRSDEAVAVLDQALANLRASTWPAPVLRHLKGELGSEALLEIAAGPRQQAEAHMILGLEQMRAGDSIAARRQLQWVMNHGASGSIGRDVARATLARIDASHPELREP
jgi:tetratricopeptide (TPR) repeat protein